MQLKYYIYASDSKVDMLFSQIPRRILTGLAAELKVSLGLLSSTLKQAMPDENRYSELRIVNEYIRKNHHVGSVDNPGEYFSGSLPMKWAVEPFGNEMVFFAGSSGKTVFGLGGSARHLIGASKDTPGYFPWTDRSFMLGKLEENIDYHEPPDSPWFQGEKSLWVVFKKIPSDGGSRGTCRIPGKAPIAWKGKALSGRQEGASRRS